VTRQKQTDRFTFIDRYRAWAVIWMIETHVFNSFLVGFWRDRPVFQVLDFLNGLVAPSFLFLAGFSFTLALKQWDELINGGAPLWKQVRRYLLILAIGYALHVPHYSLRRLAATLRWHENQLFWGVDILHCIAVSLLLLLVAALIVRKKQLLFPIALAAGIAASILTPTIRSAHPERFFIAPLAGYLQRLPYSIFPLFPWAGYVWIGSFCSFLWSEARKKGREEIFFNVLLIIGAGIGFTLSLAITIRFGRSGQFSLNPAHPLAFFLKAGLVSMILALFFLLDRLHRSSRQHLLALGQESLLAYSFHIVIIFGSLWTAARHSLDHYLHQRLALLPSILMFLGIFAITWVVTGGWRQLKTLYPRASRWLHLSLWLAVLIFFSL